MMDGLRETGERNRKTDQAHLMLHGRECPECGVLRQTDEYGKKNNGEPQDICKSCKQRKGDETKAKRLGFESVEAMREHYLEKRAERDRAKVAKRYNYTSKPKPFLAPKTTTKHVPVDLSEWDTWLRTYVAIADVVKFCSLDSKYSVKIRHHWATPEKLKARGVQLNTRKPWQGGNWPWHYFPEQLWLPPENYQSSIGKSL